MRVSQTKGTACAKVLRWGITMHSRNSEVVGVAETE